MHASVSLRVREQKLRWDWEVVEMAGLTSPRRRSTLWSEEALQLGVNRETIKPRWHVSKRISTAQCRYPGVKADETRLDGRSWRELRVPPTLAGRANCGTIRQLSNLSAKRVAVDCTFRSREAETAPSSARRAVDEDEFLPSGECEDTVPAVIRQSESLVSREVPSRRAGETPARGKNYLLCRVSSTAWR